MGTPLGTPYAVIADDAGASGALFFPVGDVTPEVSTTIARDRQQDFYINNRNPSQFDNGVTVSPRMPHRRVLGFDLPFFPAPWTIVVVGQGAIMTPVLVNEQTSDLGLTGAPIQQTPGIQQRGGAGADTPQAMVSNYVRAYRFETDAAKTATPLVTPSLTPEGGSSITLDPAKPILIAAFKPDAQAATGDNAFFIPASDGSENAAQRYPYFTGVRVISVAPGDRADGLNGEIALDASAPQLTAAVTVIAAFNCELIGRELT